MALYSKYILLLSITFGVKKTISFIKKSNNVMKKVDISCIFKTAWGQIDPKQHLCVQYVYRSWMVGRSAPIILSADLTVRCNLFLSSLVAEPNQAICHLLTIQAIFIQWLPG